MRLQRLGLPRLAGSVGLLLALLVSSLGSGLYAPVSLLYFHDVAGLDLPTVGLTLSAGTLLALPAGGLAGVLVDRVGARRVVAMAEALQGIGFLGYLGVTPVTGGTALLVTAFLVSAGQRLFWSSLFSLLASISGAGERDRWYGLASAVQNAGLALGGLLTGVLVGTLGTAAFTLAVVANGGSSLLSAALLVLRVAEPARERPAGATPGGYGALLADHAFLWLIASNAAFAVCSVMLVVGLPVYASEALAAPGWVVGAVFAMNTILLAALQTVIVRALESHRRTRAMALAGVLWAAWCILLAGASIAPRQVLVPYLFAVTAMYTLAELVHAAVSTALAAAASPEALRGRYLAGFQFSWSIATIVAPTLFSVCYVAGPALPWLAVAGLALVATAAVCRLETVLPAEAVRRATAPTARSVSTS